MKDNTVKKAGVLIAIVLFVGFLIPASSAAADGSGTAPDVQDVESCVKVEPGHPIPSVTVDPRDCVVDG